MKTPLATTPDSQGKPLAYDDKIAWEMAEIAQVSYQAIDIVKQTMCDQGFDRFTCFDRDDTQAFLVGNAEKLVLIFRGTEPENVRDWMTSGQLAKVKACGGKVHLGFWEGCQDVWSDVESEVQRIRRQYPAVPLLVTGHSLGGALALLAAAQLQMCGHQVDGIYTFGCPRIGDRNFAMQYNRRLYDCTFRLVNHRDIVPQLPPVELSYTHVGQLIYFDATGVRRISPYPQDNQFDWAESFHDHSLDAYKKSLEITQTALQQEQSIH